jgi:hypothetical protein
LQRGGWLEISQQQPGLRLSRECFDCERSDNDEQTAGPSLPQQSVLQGCSLRHRFKASRLEIVHFNLQMFACSQPAPGLAAVAEAHRCSHSGSGEEQRTKQTTYIDVDCALDRNLSEVLSRL